MPNRLNLPGWAVKLSRRLMRTARTERGREMPDFYCDDWACPARPQPAEPGPSDVGRSEGRNSPTRGEATSKFSTNHAIVTHPAFRLGFLDMQHGRPFDHEKIVERILAETPASALKRIGWDCDLHLLLGRTALSQARYEEGRLLQLIYGIRCRGWGHPDYPPRGVIDWLVKISLSESPPSSDCLT
ncbi:hypothetical protein [Afifella aestuarii]|uniref:hypothetical protein n=1 Tax=Afifella aestuarii TaxID=1909496 RepID=UPI000FE40953|nr:hypothetical protein [Afifella aestuarii]